jgi:hypothetical protein
MREVEEISDLNEMIPENLEGSMPSEFYFLGGDYC